MTTDVETSAPSVDELEAKSARLDGDVDEAKAGLDVVKTTFADAAKADPTAVEALLEAKAPINKMILEVLHKNVESKAHSVMYRLMRDSDDD